MTSYATRRGRAKGRREHSARLRAQNLQPWWKPTPKWWVLLVAGVTSLLGNFLISGEFGAAERGIAGLLVISLGATWAKSNEGKGG